MCFYCGGPVLEPGCEHRRDWLMVRPASSAMVREHKKPTARGGLDVPENVACSCRACNGAKGGFTVDEFRLLTGYRRGDLNFCFAGEPSAPVARDWLICPGSDAEERLLVIHNLPSAQIGYDLRNSARVPARGRA